MRRVIIESRYAGDIETNIKYARACIRHSLSLGEAPIASHLLYTQEGILKDEVPQEREWGILAGLAWLDVAEAQIFYTDLGMSSGMETAELAGKSKGVRQEYRVLPSEIITELMNEVSE